MKIRPMMIAASLSAVAFSAFAEEAVTVYMLVGCKASVNSSTQLVEYKVSSTTTGYNNKEDAPYANQACAVGLESTLSYKGYQLVNVTNVGDEIVYTLKK